ncbi:MAG: 16S rRNA (cytosine(1402)-N(4))-methyltransferase RsmH [Paludibacteraceae bacterium]|jgi:16S rRNA (cytosine1402-N4)-methyltransferase|nr:16S rRNA (cytosine(1402)-N(4))-methyltransferase RsmH [Paludibacteraceae bacterium]MEE0912650.1 16S rRNA (cytosine(1402)-N(4))-methyltransferase RsmH [Paludibacteraceae bacterium]
MEKVYHTPALLYPCMDGLAIKPSGIYVDVTFGGGGHSREILSRLNSEGRLFGFDQDLDAMQNIIEDTRFTFVRSNFRYISNFMEYHGVDKVDGILADLGVSFHHFDESDRGFSFRFDGKLDMRMNQRAVMTAADVLNRYTEEQLADLFYYYGELKSARKIASVIVAHRTEKKFEMISDLVNVVEPLVGKDKQKKNLACLFQALRIEVNREMEVLKKLLQSSLNLLNPGGRLVILTYHSLEDRLVKNFMKSGNFEGKVEQDFFGNRKSPFKLVNNKVIVPDSEEIAQNPRSRSAKLRIAEFLGS